MRQRHLQLNVAGSNHFVTTVTRIRGLRFVHEEDCQNVLRCFEYYRVRHAIDCIGYVLMPDHFHALLHQETANAGIPALIKSFKQHTSKMLGLHENLGQPL